MVVKYLGVGINYKNTANELRGCVNDVHMLQSTYSFLYDLKKENTMLLIEEQATKQNILNAIAWLVTGNSEGDLLLFSYSGHGSQIRDTDGDESDGLDEVIIPSDFMDGSIITDDELKKYLADRVGNAYLVAVIDACHSGTVLDLNYTLRDGIIRQVNSNLTYPKLNCVLLSGCRDDQTSADAYIDYKSCGALTYYWNKILTLKPKICFRELLMNLQELIQRNGYAQIPQLSFNVKPDLYDQVIRTD